MSGQRPGVWLEVGVSIQEALDFLVGSLDGWENAPLPSNQRVPLPLKLSEPEEVLDCFFFADFLLLLVVSERSNHALLSPGNAVYVVAFLIPAGLSLEKQSTQVRHAKTNLDLSVVDLKVV